MPLKIPTRVISADQVQMELNQQSEEELQETLADIQRAISLGDPDIKPDSVVLARFLSKNNLLGEVVNKMSGLEPTMRLTLTLSIISLSSRRRP